MHNPKKYYEKHFFVACLLVVCLRIYFRVAAWSWLVRSAAAVLGCCWVRGSGSWVLLLLVLVSAWAVWGTLRGNPVVVNSNNSYGR